MHILDLVENSITVQSARVTIKIVEDIERDILSVEINDDGRGMNRETIDKALDPFFTTKPGRKVGLGLPLFAQAARESGGKLEIESSPGGGTKIRAYFRLSHPDRKPLGNMKETMDVLRASHPEIEFSHEYIRKTKKGGQA